MFSLLPLVFKVLANPGPGTYSYLQQLDRSGNYSASKHQRTCTTYIKTDSFTGPKKGDRIPQLAQMKPGPTRYEVENLTALSTKLLMSQSRKGAIAGSTGMGTQQRCVFFKSKSFTPGPGSYQAPSAFGQYVSKNVPNMDSVLATSGIIYDSQSRSRICKTPTEHAGGDRYGKPGKRNSVRRSAQSTGPTTNRLTKSIRLSSSK